MPPEKVTLLNLYNCCLNMFNINSLLCIKDTCFLLCIVGILP